MDIVHGIMVCAALVLAVVGLVMAIAYFRKKEKSDDGE